MSEGVSETSARRKIADLETEAGCLVLERDGSLKMNQELLSQMFIQIQTEFKLPYRLAEEQEQQLATWKRKYASFLNCSPLFLKMFHHTMVFRVGK